MRSNSRRKLRAGNPKVRGNYFKKTSSVWDKIPTIISMVTVAAALTSAGFSISANKTASILEAKQFDLSLFELSLPYFENYYKSPQNAESSCQIISRLAERQSQNGNTDESILDMLDHMISSDRRNPETGPRPADMCRVLLQRESSIENPSFFEERFVVIWSDKTLDNYISTARNNRDRRLKLALADALERLEIIEPIRTIPYYGDLRLLFTGKRFIIAIAVKKDAVQDSRIRILDEAPEILSERIHSSYIWNAGEVEYCRYSFERGTDQKLKAKLQDSDCSAEP
ncbi:MAG: hypothetical protein COB08_016940 [Rhodobacteraceae bacterium]|nr:hypothetical protein [Paracoccaceae bacterium]